MGCFNALHNKSDIIPSLNASISKPRENKAIKKMKPIGCLNSSCLKDFPKPNA